MSNHLIELRDIHYSWPGGGKALKGLDLSLHEGERLGLMGPNGAGKTTLLHVLMGLIRPERGSVSLFGHTLSSDKEFEKARLQIGFMFQNADDQLFCPSVLDDVAFGPLNQGLSKAEARQVAIDTLESLGLSGFEDRVPYRLSGGEKRLVALATVLAMRPKLLVLDEPTTGLSPEARDKLVKTLDGLDIPRIIVSHEADFLSATTDTIRGMKDGRLLDAELVPHTHTHVHEEGDVPHRHD
ncbi:energy-coupling factor ABC transporter ATP-binding protein [Salidesulfovibrio brasiliensis]|uniref:energy-coupling factor ABC transporter ATP-binding protein n=1 Tax=Salidesulfovibrio brasiliensis TaxID=221711 RepID=UPI0006D110A1|nr:ABC transporter ATP-binding protein [Salidesulfovibrio brasiliensis]